MPQVKFTKGQKVWAIGTWDNYGTFAYRLLTIESWGKKQGTATSVVDGKFVQQRVYTDQANTSLHGSFFFPESADPVAKALNLAQRYITEYLNPHYESRLAQPVERVGQQYLDYIRGEQAKVQGPRALAR